MIFCPFSLGEKVADGGGRMRGYFLPRPDPYQAWEKVCQNSKKLRFRRVRGRAPARPDNDGEG